MNFYGTDLLFLIFVLIASLFSPALLIIDSRLMLSDDFFKPEEVKVGNVHISEKTSMEEIINMRND